MPMNFFVENPACPVELSILTRAAKTLERPEFFDEVLCRHDAVIVLLPI